LYGWSYIEIFTGKQFDVIEKFFAYPLSDKPIWCVDQYLFSADLEAQRFYPGVELLCVQRTREVGDAMAPEFVHEKRGNKRREGRLRILSPHRKYPEMFDKSED
jgi:hypothetical protein